MGTRFRKILLQKQISNHMLRKDNDRTERCSAMFFDNNRSFDERVDNNPVILKMEARLDGSS